MSNAVTTYPGLSEVAQFVRDQLATKRFVLIYAYNGTGKTRLCNEFKILGQTKNADGDTTSRDTLYFSAYTEDLFTWDNDLRTDQNRVLELNTNSNFFNGVRELEMEVKIGELLERYSDFSFTIDYARKKRISDEEEIPLPPAVTFFRERDSDNAPIPIKISRGEENLFIWCWFLANVQLALDDDGSGPYSWVKFVYIDDPISSLDEQNAVAVAAHLGAMLKDGGNRLKTVISTHHPLFFNVLYNELNRAKGNRFFFLGRSLDRNDYALIDTGDTPFFHHVANLLELHEVARTGQIYTYHFNMLRVIVEKTASFLGYNRFEDCIKKPEEDLDGILFNRLLNLLSHGKYSLYEPRIMLDENKEHFRNLLSRFTEQFAFNPVRFPPLVVPTSSTSTEAVGKVQPTIHLPNPEQAGEVEATQPIQ